MLATTKHARLAILRFLEDAPRYTSNSSMLTSLLPDVGISMTRDQVMGECQWLCEQGLSTIETPRDDFLIVTATMRGIEVAQGLAQHHGVQRPAPGT